MKQQSIVDRIAVCLATGFYISMIPPGVATIATLLGIPIAILLYQLFGWIGYLPALIVLWIIGIWLCARAAKALGIDDPGVVSYDEFTTLPLIYFGIESFGWGQWHILLIGFVLHRVFDIAKPLGIGWLDRKLHGGLGIMCDDILAAIYGWIALQLLLWIRIIEVWK